MSIPRSRRHPTVFESRSGSRRALCAAGVGLLLATVGCEAASSQTEARAPVADRGLGRDAAVARAREDAALRYSEVPIFDVGAQRLGGFWIVELRTPTGGGLRYAISTVDGSIRERNRFQ